VGWSRLAVGRFGQMTDSPPQRDREPVARRYRVKCRACDQLFWLPTSRNPVPEHGHWNRRLDPQPPSSGNCAGSGQAGIWIGTEDRRARANLFGR